MRIVDLDQWLNQNEDFPLDKMVRFGDVVATLTALEPVCELIDVNDDLPILGDGMCAHISKPVIVKRKSGAVHFDRLVQHMGGWVDWQSNTVDEDGYADYSEDDPVVAWMGLPDGLLE